MTKRNNREGGKGLARNILEFCGTISSHSGPPHGLRVGPKRALSTLLRSALYFITLILLCLPVFSQSPLTVISDTITSAGGLHPSGTITVTWGRYQDNSVPRKIIFPGSKTVIVLNGVFSTSLFPNSVALPSGGCFSAAYHLTGTGFTNQTRYWTVPVSPTPVNLNDVEGSIPCTPSAGTLISPGQINGGNAQVGQALVWNGFYFAPGTVSGGGGSSPGGTNGQLQYNNLGALGGFTPGGDCTLNRPNFICTSTNGVAFAPSATVDTTNAANIASGLLAIARGGTGTGTALSQGSVVFAGALGVYSQDNGNLFWDAVNRRLGIQVGTTPLASLDLLSNGNDLTTPGFRIRASDFGTNGGYLVLNKNSGSGSYATIQAGDNANSQELQINAAGGLVTIGANFLRVFPTGGDVVIGGTADGSYRLDISRSGISGTVRIYDQTASTGVTSLLMKAGAGQSTTPLVLFQDNTNASLSQVGPDGSFAAITGGVRSAVVTSNIFGLGSSAQVAFRSAAGWDSGSIDLAMQRSAAGLLEINSGTLGVFRDLKARGFISTSLAGAGNQCASVDNTGAITVAGTGPCFAGSAATPFSVTVTTQTAVTILAATHARGVTPIATCFDNSTPRAIVACSYTRNVSGDLVFAFNPTWTGIIEVRQ